MIHNFFSKSCNRKQAFNKRGKCSKFLQCARFPLQYIVNKAFPCSWAGHFIAWLDKASYFQVKCIRNLLSAERCSNWCIYLNSNLKGRDEVLNPYSCLQRNRQNCEYRLVCSNVDVTEKSTNATECNTKRSKFIKLSLGHNKNKQQTSETNKNVPQSDKVVID